MTLRFGNLILLFTLVGVCDAMSADKTKPVFRRLPTDTIKRMEKQRLLVASLVQKHFATEKLTKTRADFAILQKVVDAKIIPRDKALELQFLGIVFGDALAATVEGLAWWEVTDEYGTDPTLRYKETTLQINVLTMISKRIEDGEECDIAHMAAWVADFIKNRSHEYK